MIHFRVSLELPVASCLVSTTQYTEAQEIHKSKRTRAAAGSKCLMDRVKGHPDASRVCEGTRMIALVRKAAAGMRPSDCIE